MTQETNQRLPRTGALYALLSASLFGSSAVVSKSLLQTVHPIVMAGLLYLGSGLGLGVYLALRCWPQRTADHEARLNRGDIPWLAAAVSAGGVFGPILLMVGLKLTPASTASLLLNFEGVFTASLAWFVFREHFDRRIAIGMAAIVCGGILVSWGGRPESGPPWGALAIIGACLCWALDNNVTRKISASDPVLIASIKGLSAGCVSLALGLAAGGEIPRLSVIAVAGFTGLLGYGLSLVLFIMALRHVGTARTGAYFSTAPFIGAALSVAFLGEPMTLPLVLAALLMGIGVWVHMTEQHAHVHEHEPMTHAHRHTHDDHHQHTHEPGLEVGPGEWHTHEHAHERLVHSHSHYPDIHHQHSH
ncbi:DMT family transporter [Candidatus Sumerlaeota bacterium]|nr:DMT family transporter [Candidatus Sumerlaeota bacterium]